MHLNRCAIIIAFPASGTPKPMDLFDAILNNQPEAAEPRLRGCGLAKPEAAFGNLRRISFLCTPSQFGALLDLLLEHLPRAADPDRALNNLERFAQCATGALSPPSLAVERPFLMGLFVEMFGFSQFMADFLVRYPHYAAWLGSPGLLDEPVTERTVDEGLRSAIGSLHGFELRQRAAIRWLRSMLVLMGARVMTGRAGEAEFMDGLSLCAAALIRAAVDQARTDLEPRFGEPMEESGDGGLSRRTAAYAVIAMGKLGACELNFSSDIDLQFVYSAEGMTTGKHAEGSPGVYEGRITNHDYFCRLTERVVAFLGSSNDEGYLFRVDLRLRPDGDGGPLARSLPSFETYHETQARPWERMAMIKACAIAGDAEFCRAFDACASALVFDRMLGQDIVSHIRELKWKIDSDVADGESAGREIKRGEGGIREIEFYVQALQLIHGPNRKSLRKRPTIEAIDALASVGLVPRDEAEQMKDDYLFLRVVEHRLQMMDLRQTHTLPADAAELRPLARRCGFGGPGEAAETALLARWNEIRGRVHRRFVAFFGGGPDLAGKDVEEAATPEGRAARLILAEAPERDIIPALSPLGLESPGAIQTLRRLGGMGRATYLTEKGRELYGSILPALIRGASESARPENSLTHVESLARAFGSFQSLYEIFHSSPPLMRLLLRAFGAANGFAGTLAAHPEYMDYLYDPAWLAHPADAGEVAGRLRAAAIRLEESASGGRPDPAGLAGVLARLRRLEYFRIGLAECAGAMDFEEVTRSLSAVADASLAVALERARMLFGLPGDGALTVLAMGKLGTRELNYHSDLDLVFCRSDDAGEMPPARWDERATAAAEWVVEALTYSAPDGAPFSVDARLRPEGASAPLAPPLSRYLDYYSGRADLWEFQSLLKVRPAPGCANLGNEFVMKTIGISRTRLRALDLGAGIVEPIRAMRQKIEAAARTPRWILCDFKKGPGGIMDLEFLAQAHQLAAIRRAEDVAEAARWTGLRADEVFMRLGDGGTLETLEAEALARNYRLLRRLESRARLLFETEKSQMPAGGEKWEALRRAAGDLFAPPDRESDRMRDAILEMLRRNRQYFGQLMPEKG